MRLSYNSPVILTFTLISTAVLVLTQYIGMDLNGFFSVAESMSWTNPLSYFRLFTHVIGHANTEHLVGNFTFILLIGPILEEKYGSKDILFMIVVTAFVTGLLYILFSSIFGDPNINEGLLGASGIVFMLIILSSLTNFQKGTIPLTFILVAILFLGKEIYQGLTSEDNISQLAHIGGGICGGILGFIAEKGKMNKSTVS
ncbi:MAG: rhomboid family intramembrane serine protease [Bacteroidia bacterium]